MRGKKAYLILFFLVYVLILKAQDVSITEKFQDVLLLEVFESLEEKYPVHFFFDPASIEGILVSADFQETPLPFCLESILNKEGLKFYISRDNQVSIFKDNIIHSQTKIYVAKVP
jgi:hypothetical protein